MADVIMRNIDALCKIQGKRKKDLEAHLGHSAGYLANKENDGALTWEQIQEICIYFGVGIDKMISFDFSVEAEIRSLERDIERLESELTEKRNALKFAKELDKSNVD